MRRTLIVLSLLSVIFSSTLLAIGLGDLPAAEAQSTRRRRPPAPGSNAKNGTKQGISGASSCRPNGDGCPLHDWMEANVPPVIEAGDTARLAQLYDQMAAFSPDPAWNQGARGWRAIAEDGAAKARAGDLRAARTACKGCHTEWRDRYRANFRARTLPR